MLIILAACAPEPSIPKGKTEKDLRNAITMIEERREAELDLIKEQNRLKTQLQSNLKKTRSDGMRIKLENEISMKMVIIDRAEHNLANQEKVIRDLRQKLDSLETANSK